MNRILYRYKNLNGYRINNITIGNIGSNNKQIKHILVHYSNMTMMLIKKLLVPKTRRLNTRYSIFLIHFLVL